MSLNPLNLGNAQEQFEEFEPAFRRRGQIRVQYDYRHTDGDLFSCIARTLVEARARRDKWLTDKDDREIHHGAE
jgi:hypothetical protein